MKSVRPHPDSDGIKRLGSDYRCYKDMGELDGLVKRFYEVVSEHAGLSVRGLLRAVYNLEQLLLIWQQKEKRRLKGEW